MNIRRLSYLAVWTCLSAVIATAAQDVPSASAQQQKMMVAISAIRSINTAEARFRSSAGGRFGSFRELVAHGQLASPNAIKTSNGVVFLNLDVQNQEDAVPGYKMRLTIDAVEGSYSLFLTDRDESCSPAFVSDTRGVIFQAQALGCRPRD